MIYLLRASHANEFELQNYAPIAEELRINVVTSQNPLTPISMSTTKLWSPTDLPDLLMRRQLLNRLIGGEQWLIGLEDHVNKRFNVLEHESKIIHTAETYTPYTHQAVELRKNGEIEKLVCTCWETIPHANEKFARLRKWKQEAYKYIDLFHTPTQRAKQALIIEGVDPNKIVVIPYGVDLSRFHPSLSGVSRKGRPTVLTVARLEKEKGMEDIEGVAQCLPGYDFLVVGRGTYKFQGPNIKTASVSYSEIHKLYQKADLFFLPSRTTPTWEEQYGMALVEAMACGLPIVTTDSGAIPEVVGDVGVIVPEGDVKSMTSEIFDIISNKARSAQLSKLSLSRATKLYDSKKVATKLAKLYLSQ
jgi:glycosyltransferase involved in cell wall biosynthesis